MSAAPATAERAKEPAPRDPARLRLLGLVRKLMDYGRDLVATLQSRNAPTPPLDVARRFGGVTLAMIITRITRGLMIAEALEQRLLRHRPRATSSSQPVEPRTRRQPAEPRASRTPRPPRPDEAAELQNGLPSAREIAARLRHHTTGAVIVEICRDLGITTAHPLWRQINDAIIHFGGNTVTLMRVWWHRSEQVIDMPLPPEVEARFDRLMAEYAQPP